MTHDVEVEKMKTRGAQMNLLASRRSMEICFVQHFSILSLSII